MSYKLEIPFSELEKINFIVEYNHKFGLAIVETENCIFALEKNEIMKNGKPIVNPNYESDLAKEREKAFCLEFFLTSLGWIRRKVRMKDGSTKDFLSDLLLQIKAGLDLGQAANIITYKQPDFSKELSEEYMLSLQEFKLATPEFIQECLAQTVKDFQG